MRIIGKSAVLVEQLNAKKDICKNLEIQLFNEFVDGVTVEEIYDKIISVEGIDILCVHSPIIKNEDL